MTNKSKLWEADANEAQLRTDMTSAIRASQRFAEWLCRQANQNAKPNAQIGVARPFVEQRLSSSIIDIDVQFSGSKNYRIGIELKNATAEVYEDQLRCHLIGLKIMQKNRSVLTAAASDDKNVLKLLVITGSPKEPKAVTKLRKIKGFENKLRWISWHDVVDAIANLPEEHRENPNVQPLTTNLKNLGFASRDGRVPKTSALDKLSKLAAQSPKEEDIKSDKALLNSFLNRIEFELSSEGFVPARDVKLKNLKYGKVERQFSQHSFRDFKDSLSVMNEKRRYGKVFVPRTYDDTLKSTESNQKIDFGVGVFYDMLKMKWFCRLYPKKEKDVNLKRLKELGSKERVFTTNNTWEIKGGQLTPKYIGSFLMKLWNEYDSERL